MIQILITGGTIDKVYNPTTGKLDFTTSHLPKIIEIARINQQLEVATIFLKDSLNISIAKRKQIVDFCLSANTNKIIISHGTDTMVDTAKALSIIKDKTIILFGAMIPYSVDKSDSMFNFGFALSSIQLATKGIYIAMNGKLFAYNKVKKTKI